MGQAGNKIFKSFLASIVIFYLNLLSSTHWGRKGFQAIYDRIDEGKSVGNSDTFDDCMTKFKMIIAAIRKPQIILSPTA